MRESNPGRSARKPNPSTDKIYDLVMLDRGMTVHQIEETLGIPKPTVIRIMREHLGLRKLSPRWVPKLLIPDQKAERLMKALGGEAPSIRTVLFWFKEYKLGKANLEDEHRSGQPPTAPK
ncbi:hypothetical protein LAZ67_5002302 [Cordylochernes scorpioides]|uniref:Uncharacterized protein n=1 Tax=Cordylochernes scorpioides TaxID=51811 RepID=A0ABY6KG99_9ARAC|nr:hypothetical protein LAZ67_5002302 [Cordylochernes scorpioides]